MARPQRKRETPRVGLALAGGGPLGGTYEVGALIALDEALRGIDVHNLDVYVGVSAGAFVSANLANGFSMAQIARIFIANESNLHPITPSIFMRPALREYWRGIRSLPFAARRALLDFIRSPMDTGALGALSNLQRCIPNALFANEPLRRFLADLYRTRGHSDDFRRLAHQLFVVATDLDSCESVVFGGPGHDHVPVSSAVQASTALPGLYPPVKIDDRYFVDGGLRRTLHASVALEQDVELLICVNPIVPYDAELAAARSHKPMDRLANWGLPVVLSQTLRSLIHSRMEIGMGRYVDQFPGRDVILFEPTREDSKMFFSNVFSYANRRKLCEHAYQATRADLLLRAPVLKPLLARHGVTLDLDVLRDADRTFATSLDVPVHVRERGRYKNAVGNELDATLDRLESALSVRH